MTPRQIRILELKSNYKLLSELEMFFPKGSTHKAAIYIDDRMTDILDELVKLKSKRDKSKD